MLVIGSRGSQLALWQANYIRARLEEQKQSCRIEVIQTTGDRVQNVALKEIGNKGLFTKEIEEALLDQRIDLAVHSLKDMPSELPPGLRLAATPEREDPRDALVGSQLAGLRRGARVGTGSLRRTAQLAALRPDLRIEPMRGNVDTRLRKLDAGAHDAIVLAAAGLRRLGWEARISELLSPAVMCPAAGQGALALEIRAGDESAAAACALLEHPETRDAITAERALVDRLGGGCQLPIGAHAVAGPGMTLKLLGLVASPDGSRLIKHELTGSRDQAEALGFAVAAHLLAHGAGDILAEVYGPAA